MKHVFEIGDLMLVVNQQYGLRINVSDKKGGDSRDKENEQCEPEQTTVASKWGRRVEE